MSVFLVIFVGVLLQSKCSIAEDVPEILNNGTSLDTEDNDIAHITCSSRADPPPVIRWEKKGVEVKDRDEGVAILSRSNASLEESHLFVAVTSNERRGEYICIATNEKGISKQAFLITGKSKGLSRVDIAAIGISVGITLFLSLAIGFFLWRGTRNKNLAKRRERIRTISENSAQVNGALIEESQSPPKEGRNGVRKPKKNVTTV
ncbi:unnamed protein product [Porites lobata]|uniref:Ig-like domain-containing protein n=1 Tax=Porites lobata TaxID=104759 RepID=A0ABN8P247_9CNID|nr:unnamed protein product [Porites lobata]